MSSKKWWDNLTDECPIIGQPCPDGNSGEFCCRNQCPRNCTARQPPTPFPTAFPAPFLTKPPNTPIPHLLTDTELVLVCSHFP